MVNVDFFYQEQVEYVSGKGHIEMHGVNDGGN